jgi:hypothetical protein
MQKKGLGEKKLIFVLDCTELYWKDKEEGIIWFQYSRQYKELCAHKLVRLLEFGV